jgi:hypothetical protein
MPTDPGGIPGLSTDPDPQERVVNSPVVLGPPMISTEAAARALGELFLANADRGDNAANDHLIAEIVSRIRTRWCDVDSTPTRGAGSAVSSSGGRPSQ